LSFVSAQTSVTTFARRPLRYNVNGGGGAGGVVGSATNPPFLTTCASRTSCATCATPDGSCLWDLADGCLSSKDYICLMPCVRQAAQCPVCSSYSSSGCGICTNKGCFWNPGSGTCQNTNCATCKKNGDCVPPGCTAFTSCGTCIGKTDTLTSESCEWNVNQKTCQAGCISIPDEHDTCIVQGGTCPAVNYPHYTLKPVFYGTINPIVNTGLNTAVQSLTRTAPLSVSTTARPAGGAGGCPSYKTCSACLNGVVLNNPSNTCTWNAVTQTCGPQCQTAAGVMSHCYKKPQTCPVPATTRRFLGTRQP